MKTFLMCCLCLSLVVAGCGKKKSSSSSSSSSSSGGGSDSLVDKGNLDVAEKAGLATDYIETFGWGGMAVTTNSYPEKAEFNSGHFDHKDGVSYIKGPEFNLYLRCFLKDAKSFGEHLRALRGVGPDDPLPVSSADKIVWTVWTSHKIDNEGKVEEQPGPWPEPGTIPKRIHDEKREHPLKASVKEWVTSGLKLKKSGINYPINNFFEKAKPGYKLYVALRLATKKKVKGQRQYIGGRYVTPTVLEYSPTPLATATIEVR